MKPLVYIAGPYSSDPLANTRHAIEAGMALWESGHVTVLIPHLSLLADLVHPMAVRRWYEFDCDLLEHCDALLRLPGDSPGADDEVFHAHSEDIGVFTDVEDLLDWAERRFHRDQDEARP